METDEKILNLIEILLTAETFNQEKKLGINDLTPVTREIFGTDNFEKERPALVVTESSIQRVLKIPEAHLRLEKHPLVKYEQFGHRLQISSLEAGFKWFLKNGGRKYVESNPTLAYYTEKNKLLDDVSYEKIRSKNPIFEDTRVYLDKKILQIINDDDKLRSGLDLIIVYAPEEIEQSLNDLVCTQDQIERIQKIKTALKNINFLKKHRIFEIGKLLLIGPPGTGKTSLALALAQTIHMPILDVRLSMVTSQYLGETSKNIDRIFDIARKLAPCILFIDEFDFIAKSRVSDDHGAMKRAVNALLKNIDTINLVKNNVLLIGATNHPHLLDEAAWRRFDEVILFDMPDKVMRRKIISKLIESFECEGDISAVVEDTDGFTGADLKMMVRESVLSALTDGREDINLNDIEKGKNLIQMRNQNRNKEWY